MRPNDWVHFIIHLKSIWLEKENSRWSVWIWCLNLLTSCNRSRLSMPSTVSWCWWTKKLVHDLKNIQGYRSEMRVFFCSSLLSDRWAVLFNCSLFFFFWPQDGHCDIYEGPQQAGWNSTAHIWPRRNLHVQSPRLVAILSGTEESLFPLSAPFFCWIRLMVHPCVNFIDTPTI